MKWTVISIIIFAVVLVAYSIAAGWKIEELSNQIKAQEKKISQEEFILSKYQRPPVEIVSLSVGNSSPKLYQMVGVHYKVEPRVSYFSTTFTAMNFTIPDQECQDYLRLRLPDDYKQYKSWVPATSNYQEFSHPEMTVNFEVVNKPKADLTCDIRLDLITLGDDSKLTKVLDTRTVQVKL